MKLDLLYEVDVPRPWEGKHPWGQRRGEQRAYREALEQIKLADRLGFHTIWAVEHHFREGRSHCPAPEAFLGALSQITEQIHLGFGVTLTPFGFTPPQRIAEKVATVDILSEGRVEWGTGRSTPMEQKAFGVDAERSRERTGRTFAWPSFSARRAMCSMNSGTMSTAYTVPPGPIASARSGTNNPVPAPISATSIPGSIPHAATIACRWS